MLKSKWHREKFMDSDYVGSFSDPPELKTIEKITPPSSHQQREPVILSTIHVPVGGNEIVQFGNEFMAKTGSMADGASTIEIAGISVLIVSVVYAGYVVLKFASNFYRGQ